MKPAFQMACDEDAIRKNPFIFKLTDVVPNDSERRIALTEEQLRTWMDFIRQDETYSKSYDEFVVLLDTGLRVSEFCGLTRKDLDFKNRRIRGTTSSCASWAANTMWRLQRPPAASATSQ